MARRSVPAMQGNWDQRKLGSDFNCLLKQSQPAFLRFQQLGGPWVEGDEFLASNQTGLGGRYCSACSKAVGLRLITFSNTSDAPLGERSPRSRRRSVATEKPKRAANCSWVRLRRLRRLLTSTGCGWYSLTPEAGMSLVLAWATAPLRPCLFRPCEVLVVSGGRQDPCA